jgi:hypothetical protein
MSPVSPTHDEARPEDERPILERCKRVGDRAFLPARVLLRQRHDGQHGEDADEDKDALHDAGHDVSEREDVILPFEERIHHERRADVRDDQEQLQERPPEDLAVRAAVRDVADGVVQHRLEEEKRRDRRDEGDEDSTPKANEILLVGLTQTLLGSGRKGCASSLVSAPGSTTYGAPLRHREGHRFAYNAVGSSPQGLHHQVACALITFPPRTR